MYLLISLMQGSKKGYRRKFLFKDYSFKAIVLKKSSNLVQIIPELKYMGDSWSSGSSSFYTWYTFRHCSAELHVCEIIS